MPVRCFKSDGALMEYRSVAHPALSATGSTLWRGMPSNYFRSVRIVPSPARPKATLIKSTAHALHAFISI